MKSVEQSTAWKIQKKDDDGTLAELIKSLDEDGIEWL